MNKTVLQCLFGFILLSLLAFTTFASLQQSVLDWQGLVRRPDNWWTIATLIDAYYGFITFGNMAMAAYVLRELSRLAPGEPASAILTKRRG